MDANELQAQLSKALPGAVLERNRFGRPGEECLWLDSKKLVEAVEILVKPPFSLDWMENLSVMQLDRTLVLTYFLRSSASAELAVLRVSLALGQETADDAIAAPSVAAMLPSAVAFEEEAAELFGIHFKPAGEKPDSKKWSGFPLRKDYSLGG